MVVDQSVHIIIITAGHRGTYYIYMYTRPPLMGVMIFFCFSEIRRRPVLLYRVYRVCRCIRGIFFNDHDGSITLS